MPPDDTSNLSLSPRLQPAAVLQVNVDCTIIQCCEDQTTFIENSAVEVAMKSMRRMRLCPEPKIHTMLWLGLVGADMMPVVAGENMLEW